MIFSPPGPGANFFGNILQPQGAAAAAGNNLFGSSNSPFGGPQPMMTTNGSAAAGTGANAGKMVTGDLDASLANLTSNLNLTAGPGK